MRATGFGFKNPKEPVGEFNLPLPLSPQKSISEKRRDLLFLKKNGINENESKEILAKKFA